MGEKQLKKEKQFKIVSEEKKIRYQDLEHRHVKI